MRGCFPTNRVLQLELSHQNAVGKQELPAEQRGKRSGEASLFARLTSIHRHPYTVPSILALRVLMAQVGRPASLRVVSAPEGGHLSFRSLSGKLVLRWRDFTAPE